MPEPKPDKKKSGRKRQIVKKDQDRTNKNFSGTPEGDSLTREEVEAQLAALRNSGAPPDVDDSSSQLASPIGYTRKHGGLPPTKKSLGQNWLNDVFAAHSIVESLELSPGDAVLEVGPGGGALTEHLLETGAEVFAVEIDRRMTKVLEDTFRDHPRFHLEHADILQSEFEELVTRVPFSIVGNLPYHITSSLLFKILDQAREKPGTIRRVVLMVQYEVARRIISRPGDSEYSILSVFCRLWGEPELVLKVDRSQFRPPPKVDAGVIRFDIAAEPLHPLPHWPTFKRLVKGTFGKRRKMLRNSMPGIAQIGRWEDLEFDWTRRPQTLSTAEFAWLASRLIPKRQRTESDPTNPEVGA